MRQVSCIVALGFWISVAWAFPMNDSSSSLLVDPKADDVGSEWIVSTSYFANQLKTMTEVSIIPLAPPEGYSPVDGPALAGSKGTGFRFSFDLNRDGQPDDAVELQLPHPLGADLADGGKPEAPNLPHLMVLTLPTLDPSSADVVEYDLLAENLAGSQNLVTKSIEQIARGGHDDDEAIVGPADSQPLASIRLMRVPPLNVAWLAIPLGAAVIYWQRRNSARQAQ